MSPDFSFGGPAAYALGSWHSLVWINDTTDKGKQIKFNLVNNSGFVKVDLLNGDDFTTLENNIVVSAGSVEIDLDDYPSTANKNIVTRLKIWGLDTSPVITQLEFKSNSKAQSTELTGSLDIAILDHVKLDVVGSNTGSGYYYASVTGSEGTYEQITELGVEQSMIVTGSRLSWRIVGSPTETIDNLTLTYKSNDVGY